MGWSERQEEKIACEGDGKRTLGKRIMTILTVYPPNIKEIEEVFDLVGKKPVFAYGKILFNPYEAFIDQFLMAHEVTHQAQQGSDPAGWWKKYLSDKDFRLGQEIEAYRAQYAMIRAKGKDRNAVARYLHSIACDLSSKMYGSIISYGEAVKEIKNGQR